MGIGDWGLGIGDCGLGNGPNPQSPIPNPQSPIPLNWLHFKLRGAIFIFILILIYMFNINKIQKNYKHDLINYFCISTIFLTSFL